MGPNVLRFLASFFEPRVANVIVHGSGSESRRILDQVFQGTVLGPPSWNVFFADVAEVVRACSFKEDLFADDLTCEKKIPTSRTDEAVFEELRQCQREVHQWGVCNRVLFDAVKEEMKIMHPVFGVGEPFKYLGAKFDCKLVMGEEVAQMLGKCKPKITAMLRRRAFYSVKDLVQQLKTHVWPLLESTMGAIFHSSTYLLVKIDRLQVSFLKEIGLSEEEAFLQYNVAPLGLRRNIGMLGLLERGRGGSAPQQNVYEPGARWGVGQGRRPSPRQCALVRAGRVLRCRVLEYWGTGVLGYWSAGVLE